MNVDSPRWCGHCKTRGDHHTDRHPCDTCDGRTIVFDEPEWVHASDCPDCNGTGYEQRTPAELAGSPGVEEEGLAPEGQA